MAYGSSAPAGNQRDTQSDALEQLPLLLRPEEVAKVLAVGRTTIFMLIADGSLESVVVGQRARRVPRDAVRAYIERLRSQRYEADRRSRGGDR